ncbi:MAG: DUF4169 domain-containing protein [Sneathiella sp.]|nr:MAG: DUF4169 domain-containing protein [Sneathiella sp.]
MGDVVNLNQFRKQKDRKGADAKARHNRARFGRSKAAKNAEDQQRSKKDSELDHKKLTLKHEGDDEGN